jgi:hypothetical protein
MTSTGCEAVNVTGHCGPDGGGGVHRLGAQADQFGGNDLEGQPFVEPGQLSRSLTKRSMRAVSERIPEKTRGRSSAWCAAPRSNSSA